MKVVGLNPIKTKKGQDAILVSVVDSFSPREQQALGQTAETVFVMRDVFDGACKGVPYEKLIGVTGRFVYDRKGFVEGIELAIAK